MEERGEGGRGMWKNGVKVGREGGGGRESVMAAKSCGRAVRDVWSADRGGEL